MTAYDERWEMVRIGALPLVAGTFVVAALTVPDLPRLAAAAGVAVGVCVVVCVTAVAAADRGSRRAVAELVRRTTDGDEG